MEKVNRITFKGQPVFWILLVFIYIVSVLEVFSATSRMTFGADDSYMWPVLKHIFFLVIGFVCLYLIHRSSERWLKYLPLVLLGIAGLVLIYLFFLKRRWLVLFGISLQPSEFAKIGVIGAVAMMLSKLDVGDRESQKRTFVNICLLTGTVCLLIFPVNLSTSILLALIVFCMMWVGQVHRKYLLPLFLTAAILGSGFVFICLTTSPQRMKELTATTPLPERALTWQARVVDFVTPDTNCEPAVYAKTVARDKTQETHANIAIARSSLIGCLPGNSVERDFIQEASCDYIFAIIIEELGLFGALGVMFLYFMLVLKTGGVAVRCAPHSYFRYLLLGIAMLIGFQALINMSVAVGIMPVTGQPLPLISTGGSSILATSIAVGMVICVSRITLEGAADA